MSLALLAACQAEPTQPVAAPRPTPSATPSATPTPSAKPTPIPVRATPRPTPRHSPRPSPRPTLRRTTASPPLCPRIPDVGAAGQVVLVVGSGGSATVRACRRQGARWVSVLGVMRGHVGYAGVAPPGAKREGDGRTPSGVFGLGYGFGVDADPGVSLGWRRVGPSDVWVDDPASSLYNTWQQEPANGRWRSAETLYTRRSYALAQVIAYNTARTPGRGSAIFLHVDHASPTTGCVSVPRAQLAVLLRWQRPGAVIVIR